MKSHEVDEVLAALGSAQHGVFAGSQVLRRGVSRDALRHRVDDGIAVRLKTDIFRLRDHPWDWSARLQAALLDGGPGTVLSHRTAAQLHRFYRYARREAIEITIPQVHDHRITLARAHRTLWLPPNHRTVVDGFPVTTVARTCFDLIGDPEPGLRTAIGSRIHARDMLAVTNDALARRGMTMAQLAIVSTGLGKQGRKGTRLARHIMARLGPSYVPPASDGETLFADLVELYRLPEPERQVPISDDHGWIGTVDNVWRAFQLIVEVDSSWHDGPLDAEADAERDARMQRAGFDVWRVRYGTLLTNPTPFMNRLAAKLRVDVGAIDPTSTLTSRAKGG